MMVARGASIGDYDRDGDLDVLITENGGPAHLWRNELSGANYLRVQLEGKASNTEGIGSQIIAVVGKRECTDAYEPAQVIFPNLRKSLRLGWEKTRKLTLCWCTGLAAKRMSCLTCKATRNSKCLKEPAVMRC